MRKFAICTAVLAVAAGGVGFLLRYLYNTRAIEPDTGLPVYSSPAFIAMIAYTVFIIILAFVLAYLAHRNFAVKEKYREVIAPTNTIFLILMAAVYTLLLVAGIAGIMDVFFYDTINYVDLARSILIALTGASVFGLTYDASNKNDYKGSLVFSIIPEVALTFWLLTYYRSHQTNPVIASYAYFALALATSAFSFYYTAGFVYGRRSVLRFIFSYSVAIYFLLTSLADNLTLAGSLCFIGLALFFIVTLTRFVSNLLPEKNPTEIEIDTGAETIKDEA